MTLPPGNPWRTPALAALAAQVASLFLLSAYAAATGRGVFVWLGVVETALAGVVLWWWTALLGRLLRGQAVPDTDGTWRSLALLYPWLTALRGASWLAVLLAVLGGGAPEASALGLTALLTLWAASILAGNAVYGSLLRLTLDPASQSARTRLTDWLNVAAALSLGMGVANLVPLPGFSTAPGLTDALAYGAGAALDVAATLLAFQAVRAGAGTPPDAD